MKGFIMRVLILVMFLVVGCGADDSAPEITNVTEVIEVVEPEPVVEYAFECLDDCKPELWGIKTGDFYRYFEQHENTLKISLFYILSHPNSDFVANIDYPDVKPFDYYVSVDIHTGEIIDSNHFFFGELTHHKNDGYEKDFLIKNFYQCDDYESWGCEIPSWLYEGNLFDDKTVIEFYKKTTPN